MRGPRGYAITIRGMPHSEHCLETIPRSWSIWGSVSAPTLMCMDTASAPSLRASSTVATSTFELELTPISVDAERWRMRPTS